jgi:wobble nucleotide-excising tRNase
MRLTRITRLREQRVFRDYKWPSDLHAFAQFNLIYGWNGCGKTTLSSLFALVEKRTAISSGVVEFEFDDATTVRGAEFSSAPLPLVRVFNRDFINATLQTDGAAIAPIYFLGEDSAVKQKQVDRLKIDLAAANAEVGAARGELEGARSKLDDFCVMQAKTIKGVLTSANIVAYNNYDKRRFRQAADPLSDQEAAAALLNDDQKAMLRRQKDALPKPSIEEVAAPAIDISALGAEVDALVTQSVVAQTLEELTSNTSLASWVRQGLALHSGEHASDSCRFCQQPFEAARRAALEAHFNDAFEQFQSRLGALLAKLNSAKQRVAAVGLPAVSQFYDHLITGATDGITSVASAAGEVESAIDELISRVESRRASPFAPAMAVPSGELPSSLPAAVETLNAVINTHNKTTAEFEAEVREACRRLETAYVAEAYPDYVRLVGDVSKAEAKFAEVQGRPAFIQREIDSLEKAILEHRRPADELNRELREYLGRDELRFELKGTGYALMRGEEPVSHLSEGERTAITFLYFLKSLQDRSFDMARGIVVIDDPVSSLDANSLFSAFGYMKERTKQCGQLIILTHNFQFFRLVKNWYRYGLASGQRPARYFLLNSRPHGDGKRTSYLGPLDPLLENHESEYHYLFKKLFSEARRVDVGSLEQNYGLPNIARRLLEAFLAFRYPNVHGNNRLRESLSQVGFDEARKTRILRLLNTYSHAGAITEPEHDLTLLAETRPVLVDVLELMKALDPAHFDGLAALVGSRPDPEGLE